MNLVVAKFLGDVLGEVKCKAVHGTLRQELLDHIECLKEDYIEEGMDEKSAYEKAIAQMGEAMEVGKALNKAHKPRMEWSVLALIIGILSIGILTFMYWNRQTIPGEVPFDYLYKQSVYIGIGFILFIGVCFFDYRYLKKGSICIYVLGIIALLYTLVFGIQINGLKRWVLIGPFAMNIYTMVMPLLLIGYTGIVKKWGGEKIKDYFILGLFAIIPILLMALEDLPTSLLTGLTLVMVLTFHIMGREFKGEKKKFLTILYSIVGGSGLLGALLYFKSPYRLNRIVMSYYPELDPLGAGYQVLKLKEVREHAALIGDAGFKYIAGYIPEPLTDTMFTTIVGCLGWIAGMGLILMVALIIIRMYKASCRVQESYGRLLSFSITTLFTIQFVYNIGMNLGLLPLSSISLPFISYGGTGMLMNLFLMGIFLSVYRKKDIVLLDATI
nr:FtsW/RodA/SpoVE family cell cycle protein [uncultured Niameybacter sp.]